MAKSETRKPKLPKVWVHFHNGFVMTASTKKAPPLPDCEVRRYAPVQPPRRCVWVLSRGSTPATDVYETYCKREGWPAADWTHCPYCGGKIARRKR